MCLQNKQQYQTDLDSLFIPFPHVLSCNLFLPNVFGAKSIHVVKISCSCTIEAWPLRVDLIFDWIVAGNAAPSTVLRMKKCCDPLRGGSRISCRRGLTSRRAPLLYFCQHFLKIFFSLKKFFLKIFVGH